MRNIELKARCPSLSAAKQIAERVGASFQGIEHQCDTYYRCLSGRLKLRERWSDQFRSSELISYHRSDTACPRASDYSVVVVSNTETLRTLLADALGITVEVPKCRTVYSHENVRIHLDDVSGLESFIEFEAVLDGSCDESRAHAKLQWLMEVFGVGPQQVMMTSYSDLLLGHHSVGTSE